MAAAEPRREAASPEAAPADGPRCSEPEPKPTLRTEAAASNGVPEVPVLKQRRNGIKCPRAEDLERGCRIVSTYLAGVIVF